MALQPTLAPALAEGPQVTEQHEISPQALPTAQHCSGSHIPAEHQPHLHCQGTVPGQGGCHDGPKSTYC